MRCSWLLLAVQFPVLAGAQAPDTTSAGRAGVGSTVSGTVRDGITLVPLGGAAVQLVPDTGTRVAHTVFADSLGAFRIADLPAGRYSIAFSHPLLDSIGVQPPLRHLTLVGNTAARVNLLTPSGAEVRTAICGPHADSDSAGVILGTVHDVRDGSAMPGIKVTGQWSEVTFAARGMRRSTGSLEATTAESGWFALCGVPSEAAVWLMASRGGDSTDLLETRVPADGFVRREVWLGPSKSTTLTQRTWGADSLPPLRRRVRTGIGVLSGRVTTTDGAPLANARVNLSDGPLTRTNERGEWTLANAPLGSRMLEVRALGYYPERLSVDVVPDAPSVFVTLATLKSVLDTIKVIANRRQDADRAGFEERRKIGHGHYITQDELNRRNALLTTDVLRYVPGLHMDRTLPDSLSMLIRGASGGWCSPSIILNGAAMHGLSAEELDDFVPPKRITGIEIYSGNTTPPQFQQAMSGCGSIVVWTKY